MEKLVPDEPAYAIQRLTKSQRRHVKEEKKENKIEFKPEDMYSYNASARQRNVEKAKHFKMKRQEMVAEQRKELKHEKSVSRHQKEKSGSKIVKELRERERLTAEEIKQKIAELQDE